MTVWDTHLPFGEALGCYVVYPSLNTRIMPSPLGRLIRNTRSEKGISLRAFAKLIGKSPGFVTQLECEDEAPSVAEETLRTVAKYLRLDPDELLVLANRTPRDVRPESPLEVTLYRKVKKLSESDQERVRLYMERIIRERGGR
jgi:HTH-type transcriptional regulator, competence development regulator